MKGFALGLALKKRRKTTWKSPIPRWHSNDLTCPITLDQYLDAKNAYLKAKQQHTLAIAQLSGKHFSTSGIF